MRSSYFDSFSDETQKIAGRKPKKERMVDAEPTPMLARVAGGAMGTGMMLGQAPLVKGYGAGRSTLYHATGLDAAHGILSSEHGIDPSFAGIGQRGGAASSVMAGLGGVASTSKKARINRYLMAESLNRMLEEHGVPLDYHHMTGNVDQFHKLMDGGMRASDAAAHITKGVTDDLIRSKKLTPQAAAKLSERLQKELPSFGKRVYMGTHPADVKAWASGANEIQMFAEKQRHLAKRMSTPAGKAGIFAEDTSNALLGGLPTSVRDSIRRLKYKPHTTEHMTLAKATEEIAKLRASGTKAGVVFGASVPTAQMGYMKDFPVVRQLVNLNPGLKSSLSKFVETYDPGRDLSFPHSVPAKNLKMVDIIDHASGNVRRLHISDAQKAVRSPIGQRLKQIAAPLAFTALGGLALYRAFKPKKRKVPASSPFAAEPVKKKKASVGSDVARIAKYVVPVVAGGAALGLGAASIADRLIPENRVSKKLRGMDKVKAHAIEGGKGLGKNLLTNLAVVGSGAGIGALAAKPFVHRMLGPAAAATPKLRMVGAGVGGYLASTISPAIIAGRETAKHPEADAYWQQTPEKFQDMLRKHPNVGAMREAALMAALPIGAAYAVRKYYPSAFARAAMGIRKLTKEFSR